MLKKIILTFTNSFIWCYDNIITILYIILLFLFFAVKTKTKYDKLGVRAWRALLEFERIPSRNNFTKRK